MNTTATKPALVVMAAGIGSRYGGLKQIEPVGPSGELIIDYSIHDALRAGFGTIVFVIRRDLEKDFRAAIEPRWKGRAEFRYVYQELSDVPAGSPPPAERSKPWGTGHAVYAARTAVLEPFGVINADDFYGAESFRVLAGHLARVQPAAMDYALVAFVLRNTLSPHGSVARGVCEITDDGQLRRIVERTRIEADGSRARFATDGGWTSLTGEEAVSMNMWGFTPTLFAYLEREFRKFLPSGVKDAKAEFMLPVVVDTLIHEELARVQVLRTPDRWYGVTYPADKALVTDSIRKLVAGGGYPVRL